MLNRWFLGLRWSKVTLYVPSTVDIDKPLSQEEAEQVVKSAAKKMSQLFGGATAHKANGFWVTEDGSLVAEGVTLVYSYGKLNRKVYSEFLAYAQALKSELNQESILIEINGKPRFLW